MKNPGFAIDLTLRGNIRDYVEVYLGHTNWRDVAGTTLQLDGDLQTARAFPVWLRFETVNGLNAPAPHLSAGPRFRPIIRIGCRPTPAECGLDPPAARARQIAGARMTRLPGSARLGSVRLSLERGDLEPGPVGAPGHSRAASPRRRCRR